MVKSASKIKDDKGRPMTWDHMKSQKKRPVRKVVIPLDDELAAAWQEATGRFDLAKLRIEVGIDDATLMKQVVEEMADAQKLMDELREQMEDKVAVFRFQGLGRRKYEDLQNEPRHAPTQEQVEMAKKRGVTLTWNPDTYPPSLIQRCLISPEMTVAEAKELWASDDWTTAELLSLLNACIEANEQIRNIDWGKG